MPNIRHEHAVLRVSTEDENREKAIPGVIFDNDQFQSGHMLENGFAARKGNDLTGQSAATLVIDLSGLSIVENDDGTVEVSMSDEPALERMVRGA